MTTKPDRLRIDGEAQWREFVEHHATDAQLAMLLRHLDEAMGEDNQHTALHHQPGARTCPWEPSERR